MGSSPVAVSGPRLPTDLKNCTLPSWRKPLRLVVGNSALKPRAKALDDVTDIVYRPTTRGGHPDGALLLTSSD